MVAFGPGKDRKDRQRYFERQTKRRLRAEETKPDSGGVTDHGALTGLGDDDHTQYHNDTRAGTWLATAGATVKTAYEGEADTNAYTDAEKTKLAGLGGASNFTFVSSTPYTAANGELLAIDTTSTAITVDLPSGTTGDIVFIMPNDGDFFTNNVTVVPASGENFEGAAADETLLVDDNVQFYLQYTGAEWEVIGVSPVAVSGGGGASNTVENQVASNVAAIEFTNLDGGDYEIRWKGARPVTNATEFVIEVSTDNGTTWETTNYINRMRQHSTSVSTRTFTTAILLADGNARNTADSWGKVSFSGLDNTDQHKGFVGETTFLASGGTDLYNAIAGFYTPSSIVDAIRFRYSSGNISTGTFTLINVGT